MHFLTFVVFCCNYGDVSDLCLGLAQTMQQRRDTSTQQRRQPCVFSKQQGTLPWNTQTIKATQWDCACFHCVSVQPACLWCSFNSPVSGDKVHIGIFQAERSVCKSPPTLGLWFLVWAEFGRVITVFVCESAVSQVKGRCVFWQIKPCVTPHSPRQVNKLRGGGRERRRFPPLDQWVLKPLKWSCSFKGGKKERRTCDVTKCYIFGGFCLTLPNPEFVICGTP